jgi:pimeloyl-ACP methyl ester carboxylesterase
VFIVVNGGPGVSHDYLRPELDRLTKWGEVVFYDQRGCGKTPQGSSYSMRDYVEDLERVVEAFRSDRQVILVGSSWGSFVIGSYLEAHRAPVAGVILSGTSGSSPRGIERRLATCADANHRTIEAIRGTKPVDPGLIYTSSYTLEFKDHGDGTTAAAPVMTDGRRMEMRMPGHDPWFTDPERYFSAVGAFVALLESPK